MVKQYLRDMRNTGYAGYGAGQALFGGEIEIRALVDVFSCCVEVYAEGATDKKPTSTFGAENSTIVKLVYCNGDHYKFIHPNTKEITDTKPDGNCLFYAYLGATGQEQTAEEVSEIRSAVVDHIDEDEQLLAAVREMFEAAINATNQALLDDALKAIPEGSLRYQTEFFAIPRVMQSLRASIGDVSANEFLSGIVDEYIERMRNSDDKAGEVLKGGEIEILAFADLLGCEISVIDDLMGGLPKPYSPTKRMYNEGIVLHQIGSFGYRFDKPGRESPVLDPKLRAARLSNNSLYSALLDAIPDGLDPTSTQEMALLRKMISNHIRDSEALQKMIYDKFAQIVNAPSKQVLDNAILDLPPGELREQAKNFALSRLPQGAQTIKGGLLNSNIIDDSFM